MNILCIGGGPAGLYFALLMKRQNPEHLHFVGNGLCGVWRKWLLNLLQERAMGLGVNLVLGADEQDDQAAAALSGTALEGHVRPKPYFELRDLGQASALARDMS